MSQLFSGKDRNSVSNLMCVGMYGISGKFVGINYALLPNREWNKKTKT